MIVRVRKESGFAGGRNNYHHADIICENEIEAIDFCERGIVTNWRWIDSFDDCHISYTRYTVIGQLYECESKNPMKPEFQL